MEIAAVATKQRIQHPGFCNGNSAKQQDAKLFNGLVTDTLPV
jgi:hypothetical protein